MPATRRSSRGTASPAGAGKQSTLSFKNKVTKSIKPVGKDTDYKSPARAKEFKRSPTPEQEQEPKSESQSESKVHDVTSGEVEQKNKLVVEQEGSKSEAEIKAAKVTDKAIEKYWGGIEASRQAKAVHRKHGEGLSTGEKVLRYFDVSSQYGPCIGIARIKRWQRAERLGLHPPIEVLAVLLKEEAKGNKGIERAHMDELLNSTAVGSVGV